MASRHKPGICVSCGQEFIWKAAYGKWVQMNLDTTKHQCGRRLEVKVFSKDELARYAKERGVEVSKKLGPSAQAFTLEKP